jgi:hypothetical protein
MARQTRLYASEGTRQNHAFRRLRKQVGLGMGIPGESREPAAQKERPNP